MLHRLDLTSTDAACRLESETESLGQPERRPHRGAAGDPAILRMRNPPAGPKRPDDEVGGEKPPAYPSDGDSSLRQCPLVSGKNRDFELFAEICERMAQGAHLTRDGLGDVAEFAGQMNPSGKRIHLPAKIIASLTEMKA